MEEKLSWLARFFRRPNVPREDLHLIYRYQAIALIPAIAAAAYLLRNHPSADPQEAPRLLIGYLAMLLWVCAFHVAIFVILRFRRLERRHRSLMKFVAQLRDYSVHNIEPLRKSLDELKSVKTDDPPEALTEQTLEKPLRTRERDTMLKIIIGMAVKGYSYDPDASRSTLPKEVADDLAALGVGVSDDTVRKYLKEAAESVLPVSPRRP